MSVGASVSARSAALAKSATGSRDSSHLLKSPSSSTRPVWLWRWSAYQHFSSRPATSLLGADISFWNDPSPLGIAISVIICVIASLNLFLDYEFISQASKNGAPKYMEWYGAFGVMVTLVWLYLEILRLLAKLRS